MTNLFNDCGKASAYKQFIFMAALSLFLSFTANAQTSASTEQIKTGLNANAPETKTNDEMQTRVKQLESQVNAMQAEIEELKKLVRQQAAQTETKTEVKTPETVAAKTENKTAETPKPETKQPAQQKQLGVDIGSARLTPYGTIFFNAFNNSDGTNNADVPLWATPAGSGNTSAGVRQTRFGVGIDGAKVGNANLKAIVEADFFGGFPAIGVGESFGVVRLRLANVRLDWEKTSVVVGQDWMVFAPNSPTSLAAAAIPQMAAAGNPWSRLPQVRLEHKLNKNFIVQGAILAPATGDFPSGTNTPFLLQPGSGASSRLPFFQSRIAYARNNWFGAKKPGSIGLSGHYGQSRVTVGNNSDDIDSLGVALDWNFPILNRVQFTGEGFFGRNLAGFQAGIFQGYNTEFAFRQNNSLIAGGARAIGTRGGWAQIGWNLPMLEDRLTAYASVGIDDPRDEDLVTINRFNFRSRNFVYALDLIYKFSPQFSLGAEFRRLQTQYLFTGERKASHVNLGASYSF